MSFITTRIAPYRLPKFRLPSDASKTTDRPSADSALLYADRGMPGRGAAVRLASTRRPVRTLDTITRISPRRRASGILARYASQATREPSSEMSEDGSRVAWDAYRALFPGCPPARRDPRDRGQRATDAAWRRVARLFFVGAPRSRVRRALSADDTSCLPREGDLNFGKRYGAMRVVMTDIAHDRSVTVSNAPREPVSCGSAPPLSCQATVSAWYTVDRSVCVRPLRTDGVMAVKMSCPGQRATHRARQLWRETTSRASPPTRIVGLRRRDGWP